MASFVGFALRCSAWLGIAAITLIAGYAVQNTSGHTGWEPFTALAIFGPIAVIGAVCLCMRHRIKGVERLGLFALTVGLVGIVLIVALDRSNRLVQYDRWIERGMP